MKVLRGTAWLVIEIEGSRTLWFDSLPEAERRAEAVVEDEGKEVLVFRVPDAYVYRPNSSKKLSPPDSIEQK